MSKKIKIIFIAIIIIIGLIILAWFVIQKNNKNDLIGGGEDILDEQDESITEVEKHTPRIFIKLPEITDDDDGDGIKNEDEVKYGTSSVSTDTDGDGLSDKNEIEKWGTDPTKWDTDGDGYPDGFEISNGYSPLGEGKL